MAPRKAPPLTLMSFIGPPKPREERKTQTNKQSDAETPRNVLDSSAPSKRHGKQRTRKKKMTTVKKMIVANRTGDNTEHATGHALLELEVEQLATKLLHGRNYRDYCRQSLSEAIDCAVTELVVDIVQFQDRAHLRDPEKARMRKRYTCGLREVRQYVPLNKIKCLIVAPDLQMVQSDSGDLVLDRMVESMLSDAEEHNTPVVFGLNRKQLAKVCKKRGLVSCIGIMDASGAHVSVISLIVIAVNHVVNH